MKIFVLGGYGKTGKPAIELLASSSLVSKIAVAGRNLEQAEKFAEEIGEKAIPVRVDGTDEQMLTSATEGFDFIVNAAFSDSVVPSIRAAIKNSAQYCDMAWGNILEQASQLGPEAKAAGITAIIANGVSPCISNLIGVHAAQQLEEVEQVQIGRADILNFQSGRELSPLQWLKDPRESLDVLQEFKPTIGWILKRVEDNGIRIVLDYQDRNWVEIDPLRSGLDVPLAKGGRARLHPYMSGDDYWGMLPTDLSMISPVEMSFGPFPPQLNAVLQKQALDVLEGVIEAETAINTFFNTIESDPQHWLTVPDNYIVPSKLWISALGRRDGRAARFEAWFTMPMWNVNGYFLTSVALVAAVRKLILGEVGEKGVLTAEKAFKPLAFLDEVAALIPDLLPKGEIINRSFDWME